MIAASKCPPLSAPSEGTPSRSRSARTSPSHSQPIYLCLLLRHIALGSGAAKSRRLGGGGGWQGRDRRLASGDIRKGYRKLEGSKKKKHPLTLETRGIIDAAGREALAPKPDGEVGEAAKEVDVG